MFRFSCDTLSVLSNSGQLVTTSGGTEGSNLVLQGHAWDFIITVATEHNATTNTAHFLPNFRGVEVIWLPVDRVGRVDPVDILTSVQRASDDGRRKGLVTIALVNSEIGIVQDIRSICQRLRPYRPAWTTEGVGPVAQSVWVHTDTVQAIGHMTVRVIDLDVNSLTLLRINFTDCPVWVCCGVTVPRLCKIRCHCFTAAINRMDGARVRNRLRLLWEWQLLSTASPN